MSHAFFNPSRLLHLVFIAGTLIGLAGCSGNSVKYAVDNPTAQAISIVVDGKSIEVGAHSDSKLTLKAGEHTLSSPATGQVRFIVYADGLGGLLNPTLSSYVVVNEVYATNDNTAQGFRPMANQIDVDGVPVNGPFTLSRDLFIEKTWSYGVHENFPNSITVSRDAKGNIKSKVFTKEDFIAFFEERQGQKGLFSKQGKSAASAPATWHATKPVELPHFTDPELDAVAEKVRALIGRYRVAKEASEQKALRKQYYDLVLEMVRVFSPKASNLGQAENQKYNDFVQETGDELGRSVQILTP